MEVPATEKRRAGLDADRRLWIIFDEFNTDIVGNSFYLEPEPPTGRFSKAFFPPLLHEFISRRKSATEVSRFRWPLARDSLVTAWPAAAVANSLRRSARRLFELLLPVGPDPPQLRTSDTFHYRRQDR